MEYFSNLTAEEAEKKIYSLLDSSDYKNHILAKQMAKGLGVKILSKKRRKEIAREKMNNHQLYFATDELAHGKFAGKKISNLSNEELIKVYNYDFLQKNAKRRLYKKFENYYQCGVDKFTQGLKEYLDEVKISIQPKASLILAELENRGLKVKMTKAGYLDTSKLK
jgi:hypothetical protein